MTNKYIYFIFIHLIILSTIKTQHYTFKTLSLSEKKQLYNKYFNFENFLDPEIVKKNKFQIIYKNVSYLLVSIILGYLVIKNLPLKNMSYFSDQEKNLKDSILNLTNYKNALNSLQECSTELQALIKKTYPNNQNIINSISLTPLRRVPDQEIDARIRYFEMELEDFENICAVLTGLMFFSSAFCFFKLLKYTLKKDTFFIDILNEFLKRWKKHKYFIPTEFHNKFDLLYDIYIFNGNKLNLDEGIVENIVKSTVYKSLTTRLDLKDELMK